MRSKRDLEGYFLIDHRNSPGISDEIAVASGLPAGAGQKVFESACFTCSHCEVIVVLNPDRSRERGYCRKCDHYICDACTAKYAQDRICLPYKAYAAGLIEDAIQQSTVSDVLPAPSVIVKP